MAFTHEAHRAVLAEFLDALDGNRAPENDGRSALRVQYLIDALLDSAPGANLSPYAAKRPRARQRRAR